MPSTAFALDPAYTRAAALITRAQGLIIAAGAGMGVDSGLPDFRGPQGFWSEYPALGRAGIRFEAIASPDAFRSDPELAWGFYGHRLKLYRETPPHAGFFILQQIARQLPRQSFVFTSNIDGQFQKSGYDDAHVLECHGSIHYLQCLENCTDSIVPSTAVEPIIDANRCRMLNALPQCPNCLGLARPNVLMFGDWERNAARTEAQESRLDAWLSGIEQAVVIEIGAGTAIATVRRFAEARRFPLVRINPREPRVHRTQDVGIPVGAREGIEGIARALGFPH